MEEKHPFEIMLDQLTALVKVLSDKSGAPINMNELPAGIDLKLAQLERDVKEYNRLSQTAIELSDVSYEELVNRVNGMSDEISPLAKRFIQKTETIKKQVEALQKGEKIEAAPVIYEEETKPEKKMNDETFRKRRRRKFRQFED